MSQLILQIHQRRKAYILTPKTPTDLLILFSAVKLFLGHRPDSLKYGDLSQDLEKESYFLIYKITKSVKFGICTYWYSNLIGKKG